MYQYSHIILAMRIAPRLGVTDPADYAWGAVAPDVRYLAAMRRSQTHLPPEQIAAWMAQYPACRSFIQGYLVHCLMDQIDVAQVVGGAFPLNLIQRARRRPISPQQAVVLAELYYLQTARTTAAISGTLSPILAGLGIAPEHTATYALAVSEYLADPSFETALSAFTHMGLINDVRVEKYLHAARSVMKNPLLLRLMLLGVKNAHLEQIADRIGEDAAGLITD